MDVTWNDGPRKSCPFGETCYRKNPIHLCEFSHPHLEKIVQKQGTDSPIEVPEVLDFSCNDRKLLYTQLTLIQSLIKNKKNKGTRVSRSPIPSNSSCQKPINKSNDSQTSVGPSTSSSKAEVDDPAVAYNKNPKRTSSERDTEISKYVKISESCKEPPKVCKPTSQPSQGSSSRNCKSNETFLDQYVNCKTLQERSKFLTLVMEKAPKFGLEVPDLTPLNIESFVSNPYGMFLSRVESEPRTFRDNWSLSFPQILDLQLGEIVLSLHMSFVVDIAWLCYQYILARQKSDMLIVYGSDDIDLSKRTRNITTISARMQMSHGLHHSKISIFKYSNEGIRIMISSANLYEDDWRNRTQGFWLSPFLPKLDTNVKSHSDSKTGFKKDFEKYLLEYRMPDLTPWIHLIRSVDFSDVNVFFIGSIPGTYRGNNLDSYGHLKIRSLLKQHCQLPENSPEWPLIMNSSSIGSLGKSYNEWIGKDIVASFSMEKQLGAKSPPSFKFIYPTLKNYKQSFDMEQLSNCLCYSLKLHEQQKWLQSHMYQWSSHKKHRSRAMPHVKSYTRVSPDLTKIGWFVITSSNLSKAAWGRAAGSSITMWNYEAGVLFLPKFVTGKETFPLDSDPESETPPFPIPYDLPLTEYSTNDMPFVSDFFSDSFQ